MRLLILMMLAALALCVVEPAVSQYDYLSPYYLPENIDPRRGTSVGGPRYIDTTSDPLSADPLMRPLDPYHTQEWISQYQRLTDQPATGTGYTAPSAAQTQAAAAQAASLAGSWRLQATGAVPRTIDLNLQQSGDVVYGSGSISAQTGLQRVSASGFARGNLLYLDITNIDDLSLYKATLTIGTNTLAGSYYLFSPAGPMLSGGMTGSKTA